MDTAAQIVTGLTALMNLAAGASGAWLWWRVEPQPRWWLLLRAAQVSSGLMAVFAGVLYASGHDPKDSLFWVYTLLPVGVSFFAEQIRLAAAQSVLDQRDLEDAEAVGRLPKADQQSVVRQILRRELGIMALSALACAFLALRALGTA